VHSLILAVVATGVWFQSALAADGPVAVRAREPGPNSSRSLGTVQGWGKTKEQAKDYALEKVTERVEKYLRRHARSLEWLPSKEYISDHFLKEPAERRKDEDQQVNREIKGKCWEWKVEVSPQDWKDILRHDRDLRVHARMVLLGKILASLLVLLSAVVGYVRLDEWTKGFYTGWLRLAAGLFAVVAVGLWWLN
jgi:hypothetical protein